MAVIQLKLQISEQFFKKLNKRYMVLELSGGGGGGGWENFSKKKIYFKKKGEYVILLKLKLML
jgi:hypothetical protein